MKLKTLTVLLIICSGCNSAMPGQVKVTNTESESIPVYLAGKGKMEHSMSEYRVITGKSIGQGNIQGAINSVQDQMKNAIGLGWQPLGGISVSVDKDYGYTCSQAIVMIK